MLVTETSDNSFTGEILMNKEKIALYASSAVFGIFWMLLMFLHFSGTLMAVSSAIPGLQAMVQFGLIGTPAIIPAILTFVVVYTIVYFQELPEESV
ncbi:MAG: hypothetical protein ACI9BF_000279 [Candidatus Paceibacteria bacterium]